MQGIDIADYQLIPDFNKIVGAGIGFVIIKATEGIHTVNHYVRQQSEGAKNIGLKIGMYHFGHPEITTHTAIDEANHCASILKTLPPADIIFTLDVEQVYDSSGKEIPVTNLTKWILDFKSQMQKLGLIQDIMLYSNEGFLNQYLPPNHEFGIYPLWLSQYTSAASPLLPKGWSNYSIWQYSEKGVVDGISGNIDLDKSDSLPFINLVS